MIAAVAMLAGASPALGRMSVVYDTLADTQQITGEQLDGSPGLGPTDGLLQQQPSVSVLPPSSQAWKVQSRASTTTTPGLAGLDAGAMVQLLTTRVRKSGAHVVFVDEIASNMGAATATALGQALTTMRATPSPWGDTFADHVHLYVPSPAFLLGDTTTWAGAWQAMAAAGGVWLEAYTSPVPTAPWAPQKWFTWPQAVGEQIVAAGGDPSRLHLMMSTGDQATLWGYARTGAPCSWLANGPGAYRVDGTAFDWGSQFRATFGTAPAATGPAAIACAPDPVLDPDRAARLDGVLALGEPGAAPVPVTVSPRAVVAGARTTFRIALGADVAGIASRLGTTPAVISNRGNPRVKITGPGISILARLSTNGTVTVTATPARTGPITATLILRGGTLVPEWAGGPVNVLGSIDAGGGGAPTARRAAAVNPTDWTFGVAVGPIPAAVQARPSTIALARVGATRARRAGINPRHAQAWIATVRDQVARPMAGIALSARLPTGRGVRLRTDAGGMVLVRVPQRRGRLTIAVAIRGLKVKATRTITPTGRAAR